MLNKSTRNTTKTIDASKIKPKTDLNFLASLISSFLCNGNRFSLIFIIETPQSQPNGC